MYSEIIKKEDDSAFRYNNGVQLSIEYHKNYRNQLHESYRVGYDPIVIIQDVRKSSDLVAKSKVWIPKYSVVYSEQSTPARWEVTAFAWNHAPTYTQNPTTKELDVRMFSSNTISDENDFFN